MVQSHLEGPLNQLSKPMIFFPCSGLFLLMEFWAGRKKIVVLWVLHSFVLQSPDVRDSEFKSEPTQTHETWLDCMGQEGSAGGCHGGAAELRRVTECSRCLVAFSALTQFFPSIFFPPLP